MEPTNLNSPQSGDDRLEAWLRQAQPELPDHGFSTRVLAALPGKKRAHRVPSRLAMGIIGSAIGVAFALGQGASLSELDTAADRLHEPLTKILPLVTDPWLFLALAVTGASLFVAFGTRDRRGLI